jgi:mannosyltransferase OCH1-like enzyme
MRINSNFFDSDFAKKCKFKWDFHKNISEIERWLMLSELYEEWKLKTQDCNLTNRIPKIIHQIWLGSPVPKKYKNWRASWKKFNNDFEYILWDEASIIQLGLKNKYAFQQTKNLGAKSDIARYEILNKFGGVYVDTDFECLAPLNKNFLKTSFFAGLVFSETPIFNNAIIGSAPGSKLIELMVDETGEVVTTNDPMSIMRKTGPLRITETFFKNIDMVSDESLILPSDFFYPWPNFLLHDCENRYKYVNADSYAIHHWEVSWVRISLRDLLRKILKSAKCLKSLRVK